MFAHYYGKILIIQTQGERFAPEPFICVGYNNRKLTLAGTNGGFGSRVRTYDVQDIKVLGYFESLEIIEQQLKMVNFTLNNELLTITNEGRRVLLEIQEALSKVLQDRHRIKTQESRDAEDQRVARYRAEEDAASAEYFDLMQHDIQSRLQDAAPPISGETFSEQAFADHSIQAAEVPDEPAQAATTAKVKVHIVIEHSDPAIVKQVAAQIREVLQKSGN